MINLSNNEWIIKDVDTVLFDKDGTFIDLHFFWGKMTELRVQEVIKHHNLQTDIFSYLCSLLGYDYDSKSMISDGITALYSRSKIIKIFNQDLQKIGINSQSLELEAIFDKVSENFYKDMISYTKPINEAIVFIKKLKLLGVKVGIVTSDSVKSTDLTLKQFSWVDLFDTIVGRESCEYPKETGEPIKLALKNLSSKPLNTIMVGDTPIDYIAGKKAGLKNSILVSSGQISYKDLKKVSNHVVKSLNEIVIDSKL